MTTFDWASYSIKEINETVSDWKYHLRPDILHEDQYNKYELFRRQNSTENREKDVLLVKNAMD